jgi:hypothetical protein
MVVVERVFGGTDVEHLKLRCGGMVMLLEGLLTKCCGGAASALRG